MGYLIYFRSHFPYVFIHRMVYCSGLEVAFERPSLLQHRLIENRYPTRFVCCFELILFQILVFMNYISWYLLYIQQTFCHVEITKQDMTRIIFFVKFFYELMSILSCDFYFFFADILFKNQKRRHWQKINIIILKQICWRGLGMTTFQLEWNSQMESHCFQYPMKCWGYVSVIFTLFYPRVVVTTSSLFLVYLQVVLKILCPICVTTTGELYVLFLRSWLQLRVWDFVLVNQASGC